LLKEPTDPSPVVRFQVKAFIDSLEDKFLGEVAERKKAAEKSYQETFQTQVYPECLLGLDPFSYLREVIDLLCETPHLFLNHGLVKVSLLFTFLMNFDTLEYHI
jgi:hypothetical protein